MPIINVLIIGRSQAQAPTPVASPAEDVATDGERHGTLSPRRDPPHRHAAEVIAWQKKNGI